MHRRCISTRVVCTDNFLNLDPEAQAGYMQLVMAADDDGFVDRPLQIARQYAQGTKILDMLEDEGYLIRMDGICIIRHWLISNRLRSDRTKALSYPEIATKIWIAPDKSYTIVPIRGAQTLYESRTGGTPTWDPQKSYEALWAVYPQNHIGDCELAWKTYHDVIRSAEDAATAMDYLSQWIASTEWMQHIPTLASWLSSGDWCRNPD